MTTDTHLDGNAMAGPLREVFAFEATTAVATCRGCGIRAPIAAWMVFMEAPGLVARCSTCETVQLRIVHDGRARMWIDLSGVTALQVVQPSTEEG